MKLVQAAHPHPAAPFPGHALASDSYRTGTAGDVFVSRDMLGTVRFRMRPF